jgi:hypothetical protein
VMAERMRGLCDWANAEGMGRQAARERRGTPGGGCAFEIPL